MIKQGTFLGIPYNWHKPTWEDIKERNWNKNDNRLFTPRVFGWGYTINFYELLHHRKKLVVVLVLLFVLLGVFVMKQSQELDKAHSSFENYYAFRGCTKLLILTDSYGMCKTNQGETIKIVKFNNKWYLDGDLPICLLRICN